MAPSSTTSTKSIFSVRDRVQGESGRNFTIVESIAEGGYGALYKVKAEDGGQYALKVERREPNRDHFKLFMEVRVLESAKKQQSRFKHFPMLIDQKRCPGHMFVVMSLLGESLGDIKRRQPHRVFSQNTGYFCALQTLEAMKNLHELGFIHRDIKPANFVIGLRATSDSNTIFMVDFGIARKFLDEKGLILTPRPKTRFKGTVRYAPLATHKQEELGRKDDCESWIYMVVDMINKNRLPWHLEEGRKEVEKMKMKAIESPELLFGEGKQEFRDIVAYLKGQHYVDKIDYDWIRAMVKRVAKREGCNLDPPYDWNKP